MNARSIISALHFFECRGEDVVAKLIVATPDNDTTSLSMSRTDTTECETDSSLTVLANISEAEPLSWLSERCKFF